MGDIVIRNVPLNLDYHLPVTADPTGSGAQICNIDVAAACTFTISENAPLFSLVQGVPEAELLGNDLVKSTLKLFSHGLQEALMSRDRSAVITKDTIADEAAAWEKVAERDGNDRYGESYQCRISDVRVSSITLYASDDTTVVYEWKSGSSAAGESTCAYCGSSVTGNFCTNCGAPRG